MYSPSWPPSHLPPHPFHTFSRLPWGLSGKESACNARDPILIPGSGRHLGGGHGNPLQCSCLENPWTEEPGGLQFMGLQRVRHDWSNWACTQTFSKVDRTRGLTFQRRKSRDWEMSGFSYHQSSGFRLWLCHLLALWCGNNIHTFTKTTMHLLQGPYLRVCGPFPSLHTMIMIFNLQMRKFRHAISDRMK